MELLRRSGANVVIHGTDCIDAEVKARQSAQVGSGRDKESQEQITQSLSCISTTGSNDLERSDTKLEAPPFPLNIEYSVPQSTQNPI